MRVLLTRPLPEAEETAKELRARGHEPVLSPALSCEALAPPRLDLENVAATLFTSANAVRALGHAADLNRLQDLPAFAVGEATAASLGASGFRHVVSADGDGAALAALVETAVRPTDGTLLWLAGRERGADLQALLSPRGFRVRLVEIYRMVPVVDLAPEAAEALAAGALDAALAFSRRSSEATLAAVGRAGLLADFADLDHVAISSAAATPLKEAGLARVVIAAKPTAAAMLDVLDERERAAKSRV